MTRLDKERIDQVIQTYIGPVNLVFWTYLEQVLDHALSDDDRAEICHHYLGHRLRFGSPK